MMDALVVIDMQNGLENIANKEKVVCAINSRIDAYHQQHKPVVFIQHIDDEISIFSNAWKLFSELHNLNDDTYFNKYYPDAFFNTGLEMFLKTNHLKKIEICGAQTEYCIDTTVKVAFHLGFNIQIRMNSFSTFDTNKLSAQQINHWYARIWQQKFANVIDA